MLPTSTHWTVPINATYRSNLNYREEYPTIKGAEVHRNIEGSAMGGHESWYLMYFCLVFKSVKYRANLGYFSDWLTVFSHSWRVSINVMRMQDNSWDILGNTIAYFMCWVLAIVDLVLALWSIKNYVLMGKAHTAVSAISAQQLVTGKRCKLYYH